MPYIHVDIDLDEFNTDDLIEELKDRTLDAKEENQLRAILNQSSTKFDRAADEWKFDYFIENMHRCTLPQLESFFSMFPA